MCLGAIYWARIDRVFYGFSVQDAAQIGFDDQFIYDEIVKPLGARAIHATQVLGGDARSLLDVYAADPARVKY